MNALAILPLFLVLLAPAAQADVSTGKAECAWPMRLIEPQVAYGSDLQSYTIDLPSADLDESRAWPEALTAYRQWVLPQLDPSPWRQERLIRDTGALDRELNRWMLHRELGRIRQASCLERLLLALHDSHVRLSERDAEFRAWILERQGVYRVYFATHPLRGWGPNLPRQTQLLLDLDLQNDWRLAVDLHNHPFDFSQSCGPGAAGGFPAPSPNDLADYLRGPADSRTEFRVTNGFFTGVLSLEEVRRAQEREGHWSPSRSCPHSLQAR
jgi:hypothetical protein